MGGAFFPTKKVPRVQDMETQTEENVLLVHDMETQTEEDGEIGTEEKVLMLDPAITFSSYVNDLIGYIFNKKLIEEDVSYHNVNYKLFITCIVVIMICYLIFVLVVGTMLYKNNYPAGKSKELRKKMIDEEYSLWILEYWYDFGYINESNFSILKISIFVYILFILYGYYLTGAMKDKLLPSVIGIVILLVYLVYIMPYNNENYI